MYKAKFKTAYLQREVPVDAVVVGDTTPLEVGALVTLVDATEKSPMQITAVEASSLSEALENATHFVAQSDQTIEYGHIPVEDRDYRYNPEVALTIGSTDYANFQGIYESEDALKAAVSSASSGMTALVYKEDGVYTKYSYDTSWTAGDDVNASEISKKVALFKIVDKDDIVVYEEA